MYKTWEDLRNSPIPAERKFYHAWNVASSSVIGPNIIDAVHKHLNDASWERSTSVQQAAAFKAFKRLYLKHANVLTLRR